MLCTATDQLGTVNAELTLQFGDMGVTGGELVLVAGDTMAEI